MNEKYLANDVNDVAGDTFDLNDLLHPAQAFDHPSEVADDPDLTLNEKRAILLRRKRFISRTPDKPDPQHSLN
jgi:hypothetical protein